MNSENRKIDVLTRNRNSFAEVSMSQDLPLKLRRKQPGIKNLHKCSFVLFEWEFNGVTSASFEQEFWSLVAETEP